MKVHLDMEAMTLGDLIAADELMPGGHVMDALQAKDPRAFVALACVVLQRDDPSFTWEQALQLRMSDLQVVNAPEGEANAGDNGGRPASSLAPGD